ncbi:hypothetical protein PTSG_03343 [Salpingoeca rosetta]|uniref:VASt domain-containing protein n=1 Tax=Salpingoeca rosetta (strain ATCC 50818 / BSB-021) TaxID=946362 RepID=F2U4W6_SALR5|nr:uncharacterized protein PTSG_03343 [Salpingoeca rosetta]EGD82682.1 hypothetical protein PTSG_03343 [Salpingoeca rosetta]|eukprot:XP_004995918.1 hypothetical protein PTSG_03343 [Salpingoeca rosetta]
MSEKTSPTPGTADAGGDQSPAARSFQLQNGSDTQLSETSDHGTSPVLVVEDADAPTRSSTSSTKDARRQSESSESEAESMWMFTSPSKHLKARKGPTSRMHKLFPEHADEIVLDDFSCALQKDVLVHGRLFVSERHFCFHANIFGWVTKLAIDCRDVLHLRKEKTALIIPNAIKLETTEKSYTFTSFIARDTAYRCLFKVWQNALLDEPLTAQELLRSSVKGWHDNIGDETFMHSASTDHLLETLRQSGSVSVTDLSRSRVGESAASARSNSARGDDADSAQAVFDDDDGAHGDDARAGDGDEDGGGGGDEGDGDLTVDGIDLSEAVEVNVARSRASSGSAAVGTNDEHPSTATTAAAEGGEGRRDRKHSERRRKSSGKGSTSKGSSAGKTRKGRKIRHSRTSSFTPSEGGDIAAQHNIPPPLQCDFGNIFMDVELPCSVETAARFMFTYSRMFKELYKKRGTTNVEIGEWAVGEDGKRVRDLSYTLQLDYSFGPSTTRGEERQVEPVPHVPGQYWIVDADVFTPHVPYGDNFYTKTRTIISRVAANLCRVRVCTETHYRKKRPWAITRQLIDSNSSSGLKRHYGLVRQLLLKYAKAAITGAESSTAASSRNLSRATSMRGEDALSQLGRSTDALEGGDGDARSALEAGVVGDEGEAGEGEEGSDAEEGEEEEEEDESGDEGSASEVEGTGAGLSDEDDTGSSETEASADDDTPEGRAALAGADGWVLTQLKQWGIVPNTRSLRYDMRTLLRLWRRHRITVLSLLVWTLLVLVVYHVFMGEEMSHHHGARAPIVSWSRHLEELRTGLPLNAKTQSAMWRIADALQTLADEARVFAAEMDALHTDTSHGDS